MEYTIVKAQSTEKLLEEVNSKIKQGWTPQGGASIANGSQVVFVQAMIKS